MRLSLSFVLSTLALSAVPLAAQTPQPAAPAAPAPAVAAPTIDTTAFNVVEVTPQQGALPALLAQQVKNAVARHRTPVVEFWAPWCGPCRDLAASLGDARMVDAFRGIYVIRLNLDDWRGKHDGTKIPEVNAIPAFYALTHDSTTTGETIDGGAWGDNIPENMAPPLKKYFTSVIQHFATTTTAAAPPHEE